MSTGADVESDEADDRAPRGRRYDDAAFVDAVGRLAADPDATPTTSAVAEEVGCGTSTVNRRCRMLAEAGELERCAIAPSHIWHPPGTSAWEVLGDS